MHKKLIIKEDTQSKKKRNAFTNIYEYDFSSISSSLNYRKVYNKSITVSTLKNKMTSHLPSVDH